MDFRAVAANVVRRVAPTTAGQLSDSLFPASGPVVEALLASLLQVEDEELELLRRLEDSVQRLADVPWKSAQVYLEDAAIPGRRPEQIKRSLEQAADRLHDAIGSQSENTPDKVDVRLVLAAVFAALGDQQASMYHAEVAYREARKVAWTLSGRLRTRMNRAVLVERRAAISRWFDDAEWAAALLADPLAPQVEFGYDGFPWQEIRRRERYPEPHAAENRFRWREGLRLDFAYIAYAQAYRHMHQWQSVDHFLQRPLNEVMDDPRTEPLPSSFELQIELEQRMGYFTGMEE